MTYTVTELRAMPTIRSGPTSDLKIDTGEHRVWVRRDADDTRPAIRVESKLFGRWEVIGTFRDQLNVPCQRLIKQP